jgi:hypothetical protein
MGGVQLRIQNDAAAISTRPDNHDCSCGPRHVVAHRPVPVRLIGEDVVCGAHPRTRICFRDAVTAPTAVTAKGGEVMTGTKTMLLAAMMWAATVSPQAQDAVTKANVMNIAATITAIDSTNRMLTLRDEKGNEDTFSVDQAVQRFDELKVGQKINITYYESIVFQLLKPGEKGSGTSFEAALNRAKSALPAGTIATQEKMTVTVKAIDPAVPSVTVATDDGRVVTRKIEDKKNLTNLKPGDRVDITFTRALVTNVAPGK